MSRGVAARAAAWQRRLRNLPGPLGPQGGTLTPFPQAPLDVLVEIRVDNSWLAITHDVYGGDRADIDITRGAPNEGSKTQPGRCQMQVNNRNGVYSPRNPTSPLYGKIGRNTEIRVKVGADVRSRGEIPAWPVSWDTTGTDVWVNIEAAGILRRLGQRQKPARSALTRRVADVSDDQKIIVHWPCEDASDATYISTVTPGAGPIGIGTGLRFAADDFLPGSLPLCEVPANTPVHYHGVAPVDPHPNPTGFEVDWFVHMPAAPAGDTRLMVVGATGKVTRWDIQVSSAFYSVVGTDTNGVVIVNAMSSSEPFFFADAGCRWRLRVRDNGGGNSGWQLEIYGAGHTPVALDLGSYPGTPGQVAYVANAVNSTVAYGVGHIIVSSFDGFTNSLSPADIGYRGEPADERARRLCAEEGVGFRLVGTRGDSHTMGPQPASPFLDLLRECETVDGGILGETVDALGLFYRTRNSLYTQQPTLTLDYDSKHLGSAPVPVDDDEQTINDVTLSRPRGASARHVETTGPLSTERPPDGVGVYNESQTVNVERDDQLPQRAAWWVHLGTVDEPRHPEIHLNMAKAVIATNPDLVGAAGQVKQGDRVTVANPPSWTGSESIDQLVVGVKERLGNFARDLRFTTVPASAYEVGVVDDPDYRIDAGGSTLNSPVDEVETTVLVAGDRWTTDAAELPFDILIGGEVMTVTASVFSGVMVFTVARSVNGIVKEHAAGVEVHVFSPFMAGL